MYSLPSLVFPSGLEDFQHSSDRTGSVGVLLFRRPLTFVRVWEGSEEVWVSHGATRNGECRRGTTLNCCGARAPTF